jgi:hemolysin III
MCAVSPCAVALARGTPVDAPPGSLDDLRGDRRHLYAFALIALRGALAGALLIAVRCGAGAAAGIGLRLAWIDAPEWLVALLHVLLGWVGAAALPILIATLGAAPAALVAAGGLLYTAGAVVSAHKRPDPAAAVFGYHEAFHVLVIAAAALQYAAIAFFVLPGAHE